MGADTKNILYPLPDLNSPAGNAAWLLNQARELMKRNGIEGSVIDEFMTEAKSSDYTHLLRTIDEWFTVVTTRTEYQVFEGDITELIP